MVFSQIRAAAVAACLSLFSGGAAFSQNFDDILRVDVLPGWRTESGSHMAAIRIGLETGWKTYWRAPGDAGIPPSFAWGRSRNLQSVLVHWPKPTVFNDYGMRTIGYMDGVVIPVELKPKRQGQPIQMRVDLEIGVCDEICIPMQVSVEAVLPSDTTERTSEISTALQSRPTPAAAAGVGRVVCRIEPISDGFRLTAEISMPKSSADETTVIELPGVPVWISQTQTSRAGGRLIATSDLIPENAASFALNRAQLRFTVLTAKRAVDIRGCTGS